MMRATNVNIGDKVAINDDPKRVYVVIGIRANYNASTGMMGSTYATLSYKGNSGMNRSVPVEEITLVTKGE